MTSNAKDGVLLSLPPAHTLLPRYKPLSVYPMRIIFLTSGLRLLTFILCNHRPKPKEPTKWELFARKKGIGKFSSKPGAALAEKERRKKLVYDETVGDWVPRWGYKGANKSGENDAIVEIPDKDWKNEAEGKNMRTVGRAERKERVKRNDRKMRANERRSRKFGA